MTITVMPGKTVWKYLFMRSDWLRYLRTWLNSWSRSERLLQQQRHFEWSGWSVTSCVGVVWLVTSCVGVAWLISVGALFMIGWLTTSCELRTDSAFLLILFRCCHWSLWQMLPEDDWVCVDDVSQTLEAELLLGWQFSCLSKLEKS